MAGVPWEAIVGGCVIGGAAAGCSPLVDGTLSDYRYWRHWAPVPARHVRNRVVAAHFVVGVLGGVVLGVVTRWFPFGRGAVAVLAAGATWAAVSEAFYRADTGPIGFGPTRPVYTLLHQASLTGLAHITESVDVGVNGFVCGSDNLGRLLSDVVGLTLGGLPPLAVEASLELVESTVNDLESGHPGRSAAARARAIASTKALITERRMRF